MHIHQPAILLSILYMGAAFAVTGCSQGPAAVPTAQQPPRQQQPTQKYRLTATIQDLMDGIIDPSADTLWDSVAYIATTQGVEDRQPRTDEQWKAVRTGAITLIEAANLLSMPGRQVAKDGPDSPPAGLGELSHPEIQQRIGASHEGFAGLARNLQDAGLKALSAIDAKDSQALMDAGGTIDEACEACHVTFWYPNQKRPES